VVRAYDASPEGKKALVLKIWEKGEIFTPQELEGCYRELRFLTEVLLHPNVARCRDFLHTPNYLYMVLDYAGDQNLATLLHMRPGKRAEAGLALPCLKQIATALEYCHSKDVAHRSIQLEHAVVDVRNDRVFKITLCDFQSAMVVHGKATSSTMCGTLPYIAPEVIGGTYRPILADCWSVGILLLEMAGGIGCVWEVLNVSLQSFVAVFKEAASRWFRKEDVHAISLTKCGAEHDAHVLGLLEAVLQVDPEARNCMSELVLKIPDTENARWPLDSHSFSSN